MVDASLSLQMVQPIWGELFETSRQTTRLKISLGDRTKRLQDVIPAFQLVSPQIPGRLTLLFGAFGLSDSVAQCHRSRGEQRP
jgi:hypothetical protein